MMTAMLTVENIMAGETVYDIWNVNEDAEYHEAGEAGARAGARQRAPGAAPACRGARADRWAASLGRVDRRHRAAALALFGGERAGAGARLCGLSGAHNLGGEPAAGRRGRLRPGDRAALPALDALRVRRRATDKVQARLFGEFALSGHCRHRHHRARHRAGNQLGGLAALPAKVLAAAASFIIVFGLRRAVVFSPRSFGDEDQPDHGRA